MGSNKRVLINVFCSIMVLMTNILITFFLSPFIVKNIGVEANGFVTLANNFVMYANLIVTALNSMAARFIAIEYVRKDYKKANLYYNSVFWGNIIIVAVLLLPAAILIANLDKFDVPTELLFDVKLLFVFVFFNFFITTGLPNWGCGTFISNRLDRDYVPNMAASVFKCAFLYLIFTICAPKVYFVGVAATIVTLITLVASAYNTHVLTPELRVSLKPGKIICSKVAIKELVGSGIWSTISNIGNMLLSGLDLILCNMFIGATAMGVLSVAKTIPNYVQNLSASVRGAFSAELTITYAKGDIESLYKTIDRAMKLTSVIITIPISVVVVLGDHFFALWQPTLDANLLQILSILSILGYMFTSGTQILYSVFNIVNKVKQNAIAMIISGVISCGITFICVKYTNLGMFAVAGVSTCVNLVRNMTFTLPFTAKCLGYKWNVFYRQVGMTVLCSIVLVVSGFFIKRFLPSGTWLALIISCGVLCIIGIAFNCFIILNKNEREIIFNKIIQKIPFLNK